MQKKKLFFQIVSQKLKKEFRRNQNKKNEKEIITNFTNIKKTLEIVEN